MADLDKKVQCRVKVQKRGKLQESKARIAEIFPRIVFKQRMRAFVKLKALLNVSDTNKSLTDCKSKIQFSIHV